jgi:hypothetical protein
MERLDFETSGIEGWTTVTGQWTIEETDGAPSGKRVLVQRATRNAYNVIVAPFGPYTDVDVAMKFKPISGREDASGGIVFRFADGKYYIVRANALEDNVVLYKVEGGKRTDLPLKGEGRTYGKKSEVPAGQWSTLRVVAHGAVFEVYFNGSKLYEVEDKTFSKPGKVGVWTKADSVTQFDDLSVVTK